MGYSMRKNKTYHRKKTVLLWVLCMGMMVGLAGRLVYLCVFRSVYYSEKADDLHERERGIKAARGRILDANGEVLAANRTVCTISVIHSQIEEPEAVIAMLVKELEFRRRRRGNAWRSGLQSSVSRRMWTRRRVIPSGRTDTRG